MIFLISHCTSKGHLLRQFESHSEPNHGKILRSGQDDRASTIEEHLRAVYAALTFEASDFPIKVAVDDF